MFEQRDCSSIGASRDEQRVKKLPFDLVQQGPGNPVWVTSGWWFYVAFRAGLATEGIPGPSAYARPWPLRETLNDESSIFKSESKCDFYLEVF